MAGTTTIGAKCPVCGFPVAVQYEGQKTICAYCGQKLEAIANGVTIPTSVFVGILCFAAGMLFGPAVVASTEAGRAWLERQARRGR